MRVTMIARLTQALACLGLAGCWVALYTDPVPYIAPDDPRSIEPGERFGLLFLVAVPGLALIICGLAAIVWSLIFGFRRRGAWGVLTVSVLTALWLAWYYLLETYGGTGVEFAFWRPVTLMCVTVSLALYSTRSWRRPDGSLNPQIATLTLGVPPDGSAPARRRAR
jgi:hypothetical protein